MEEMSSDEEDHGIYTQTENPMDITTTMMSPTTAALLANMNISLRCDASTTMAMPEGVENAVPNEQLIINNGKGRGGMKQRINRIRTNIGPNETTYMTNHDAFVSKTISRHVARTRRSGDSSLPDYTIMNKSDRKLALENVDKLLTRLDIEATRPREEVNNYVLSSGTDITTLGMEGAENDQQTFDCTLRMQSTYDSNDTTTLGDHREEDNESEMHVDLGQRRSTFDSNALTTLGGDLNESHIAFGGGRRTTFESNDATTLGGGRRSTSLLLDESAILLSIDDGEGVDNYHMRAVATDEEDIERARFKHANDDYREVMDTTTPPSIIPPVLAPTKRCASNSGKRGSKVHPRVDDSFLGHCDAGLADGKFPHDRSEDLSFGTSPIQRRFSDADLNYSDRFDNDEKPPRVDDAVRLSASKHNSNSSIGNDHESDENSRFSAVDNDNDNVSFGGDNDNHDGNFNSQWDNAEVVATQWGSEAEDGVGESPVRRRAIRFEGTAQQMTEKQSQRRSLRGRDRKVMGAINDDDDDFLREEEEIMDDNYSIQPNKIGKTKSGNDPIETVRNLCRRAKTMDEMGMDSLEEVAPIDVRLRDGVNMKMDPLRMNNKSKSTKKQQKGNGRTQLGVHCTTVVDDESDNSLSDPEPSFKDPISDFPSRVAVRLNAGLNFLLETEAQARVTARTGVDTDECKNSSAALLSMSIRQIVSVVTKLLVQTRNSARLHQRAVNGHSFAKRLTPSSQVNLLQKDNDFLAGGTLIVCRGKEDIERWEVALREYTSLSVLNHAGIPASLRKITNTAGKCAGFDVVLTTYDSMKTAEATIPVDSTGLAILGGKATSNNDDGWFTSRDMMTQSGPSAKQKCFQLSVLLRLSWFRVIFIDILGPKGYTTKPGTARLQAVLAINAKSRQAFFEKSEEDISSQAEKKFFDDRKKMRTLITTLHLPDMKLDKFMRLYIRDVAKLGGPRDLDLLESSSSDSDASDEEMSNG